MHSLYAHYVYSMFIVCFYCVFTNLRLCSCLFLYKMWPKLHMSRHLQHWGLEMRIFLVLCPSNGPFHSTGEFDEIWVALLSQVSADHTTHSPNVNTAIRRVNVSWYVLQSSVSSSSSTFGILSNACWNTCLSTSGINIEMIVSFNTPSCSKCRISL